MKKILFLLILIPYAFLGQNSYPTINNVTITDSIDCFGGTGELTIDISQITQSTVGLEIVIGYYATWNPTYFIKAASIIALGTATTFSVPGLVANCYVIRMVNTNNYYAANPLGSGTSMNGVLDQYPLVVCLIEPDSISSTTSSLAMNLCFGQCIAEEQVTINGGTKPYSINLNGGTNQTLASGDSVYTFTNLCEGIYNINIIDANNCPASQIFTINEPSEIFSNDTLVSCDLATWNGQTYNSSGNYSFLTTNSNGCDSTANLNLTIDTTSSSNTSLSSCVPVSWNGQTYSSSGNYSYLSTNSNGCDSTANLNLTINPTSSSNTSLSSCVPVSWNGQTYSSSGNYSYLTTNSNGCDSTANLNLTINPSTTSTSSATSCDTYPWNGTTYSTTGTYTYLTTNANGCDSTATLNLTINPSGTSSTPITSCVPITWNGTTYSTTGTYDTTFTLANQWQLVYENSIEGNIGTEWNTTSSIYYNNTNILGNFGDTLVSLDLNNLPSHDSIMIEFDLYLLDSWDGNSGVNGPDYWNLNIDGISIINTTFSNHSANTQSYPDNYLANYPHFTNSFLNSMPFLCSGAAAVSSSMYKIEKTIHHNQTATNISFFDNNLQNLCDESWGIDNIRIYCKDNTNCDSTATLNLTINPPTSSNTSLGSCDPVIWNGQTYGSSGNYSFLTTNSNGCDSTANLNLTINPTSSSNTSLSSCVPVSWNGQTYSSSGNYSFLTTNSNGCDSTANLNLVLGTVSTSSVNATECGSYIWNAQTYTSTGTYTYTTTNASGCDSIVTLNLVINPPTSSNTSLSSCDPVIWNGQTYGSSGNYFFLTTNSNGCDSTANLSLTINPTSSSNTSLSSCDQVIWNGQTYGSSGNYSFLTTNSNGCDSTANLSLTINPTSVTATITVDVCNSYYWNGTNYENSGVYSHTTTNNLGCDSSIILTLNVFNDKIFVPNTFTPNKVDHINDRFFIDNNFTEFKMWIYNRWGEEIFYTEDGQLGWDGKYKNKICQDGLYVWKIAFVCGKQLKIETGQIFLLK